MWLPVRPPAAPHHADEDHETSLRKVPQGVCVGAPESGKLQSCRLAANFERRRPQPLGQSRRITGEIGQPDPHGWSVQHGVREWAQGGEFEAGAHVEAESVVAQFASPGVEQVHEPSHFERAPGIRQVGRCDPGFVPQGRGRSPRRRYELEHGPRDVRIHSDDGSHDWHIVSINWHLRSISALRARL